MAYRFRGKRQFIKLFGAGADEIRSIIDENDIRFSLKDPSSIVTILKNTTNYCWVKYCRG